MVKKVIRYLDKLEDKIRAALSRRPIAYAFVGAVGIILVWKGVWEMAAYFPILSGPGSFILGVLILLLTGLLVSFFIGDRILLSGLRGEKKLAEKTEKEVLSEREVMHGIAQKLEHLEKDVHELTTHDT